MSAELQWSGLDELYEGIRRLPDVFQDKAGRVVQGAASSHHAAMLARFPAKDGPTGNLRRGNLLVVDSPLKARSVNVAPHAHLYEKGFTHAGNGREVPGREVFVPAAIPTRSRMVEDLRGVLAESARSSGFEVR